MKQIRELKSEALEASGLDLDHRWKQWVKFVDRVDESKADGYAFIGDFIRDGTVEVDVPTPRVLLVMAESGSARYHYPYYVVLILRPDGTLEQTEIETNGVKKGWALRIRQQVADLLASLQPQVEVSS